MYSNKFKAIILAGMMSIAVYLGHGEYKNHPFEYAKEVLDFTGKALVLLNNIPLKREEEQAPDNSQKNKKDKNKQH
jgi:hypothetical protein